MYWQKKHELGEEHDTCLLLIKSCYYSFKIFPQFWLAYSTCIIHHNQLLMTEFGRTLCLTRKWHQKCSLLQVNAPLTEKTWGRDWVVFVGKTKMVDTSLLSRVRTTAGTWRNNGWKHSKNSKKTTRRVTFAIWRIFVELDKPKRVIRLGLWPQRITPSSISIILHKILSLIH